MLCKDLEVASIPALGIPNHPLKTIIVNINTNDYKLSRTIHHEIFHIINDQYKKLFDHKKWKEFNSEDFKYRSCSTCTDKFGMKLLREKKGFLSEYSQSTVSEDMAETFSFLMIENPELRIKLQNDDNLKKKEIYLHRAKGFLNAILGKKSLRALNLKNRCIHRA